MSRLTAIPRSSWLNGQLFAPTFIQGEGEGLRLEFAETANGAKDKGGFGTTRERGWGETGQGADAVVARRQHWAEAARGSPGGFWLHDSCKVLGSNLDFLKEVAELRVAMWSWQGTGLWDWVGVAKGQKVSIIQVHSLAIGDADGIDVSTW